MPSLPATHLFTMRITLHPLQDLGATPLGHRRIAPVSGGDFAGNRLRGVILPHGGADWLLARADGWFQQDVRMTLQTEDGALIGISYRGVRHSSPEIAAVLASGGTVDSTAYYLRIAPFFETGDPRYFWLNHIVAVGVGERLPNGAAYEVFEVL